MSSGDHAARAWARVAGAILLILGLPPIAVWLGYPALLPPARALYLDWLTGTALTLGVGLLVARVWRGTPPSLPWPAIERAALAAAVLLPLAAAWWVFERHPLLVDEVIQVWQGRIYAAGHLAAARPPNPEFWGVLHVVEREGMRFAQFPPGWSVLLALGTFVHAEWLMAPLCALVGAFAWRAILRHLEPDAGTRALALLLFAVAPFGVFMAGSHMNHGPTLAAQLLGIAGLAALLGAAPTFGAAVACGVGFGIATTIRPLDGAAFAAPAALWILWRTARGQIRVPHMLIAALAGTVPVAAMLFVNARTTGHPFLFGYQLLWGHTHDLGFHAAPWGPPHTPAHGLALLNAYFVRLQETLFELPLPSLLPAAAALLLARRASPLDRYLLLASALTCLGYFAYWHDGNFLGPRFVFSLLPVLTLWTARLPALVAERAGRGSALWRGTIGALAFAGLWAVALNVPIRATQYRNGFVSMRWDLAGAARAAGVRDALVFVRESWGAQLVSRLWAQGASRSEAERLYRAVDACSLDSALTVLEGAPRADALELLRPLARDSARLVSSPASPDTTERYLPGKPYPQRCLARVHEDASGYLNLLPFLLVEDGNVYVRDLHERDSVVAKRYPNRKRFIAVRTAPSLDATVRFVAVDSAGSATVR